jgi:hypothetical protein
MSFTNPMQGFNPGSGQEAQAGQPNQGDVNIFGRLLIPEQEYLGNVCLFESLGNKRVNRVVRGLSTQRRRRKH